MSNTKSLWWNNQKDHPMKGKKFKNRIHGMKGKTHTTETKNNISNKVSKYRLGKKHSEETKKKLSKAQQPYRIKNSELRKGERSPFLEGWNYTRKFENKNGNRF